MKKIIRFLRNNQWAIAALFGVAAWIGALMWLVWFAMDVFAFQISMSLL